MDLEDGPMDLEDGPMDLEDGPMDLEDGPMDLEDGPMDLEDGPGPGRWMLPPSTSFITQVPRFLLLPRAFCASSIPVYALQFDLCVYIDPSNHPNGAQRINLPRSEKTK